MDKEKQKNAAAVLLGKLAGLKHSQMSKEQASKRTKKGWETRRQKETMGVSLAPEPK